MKRLLLATFIVIASIACLCHSAFARWHRHEVRVTTNITSIVLDDVFANPVELDGFYVYPAPAVFTNNVTNAVHVGFYPVNYAHATVAHQVYTNEHTSGTPLLTDDLGLIVKKGDTIVWSNSVYPGRIIFNFRME